MDLPLSNNLFGNGLRTPWLAINMLCLLLISKSYQHSSTTLYCSHDLTPLGQTNQALVYLHAFHIAANKKLC